MRFVLAAVGENCNALLSIYNHCRNVFVSNTNIIQLVFYWKAYVWWFIVKYSLLHNHSAKSFWVDLIRKIERGSVLYAIIIGNWVLVWFDIDM